MQPKEDRDDHDHDELQCTQEKHLTTFKEKQWIAVSSSCSEKLLSNNKEGTFLTGANNRATMVQKIPSALRNFSL